MIELTRLNGRPMVVNSDLIKTAEASPDTMLTLINGEKLIVREEIGEVVEKVLAYRARLLAVVAKRLHHFSDLERAAALASLDAEGQPAAPIQMKQSRRSSAVEAEGLRYFLEGTSTWIKRASAERFWPSPGLLPD